jgi:flagellar basal-body rod protein FlgB
MQDDSAVGQKGRICRKQLFLSQLQLIFSKKSRNVGGKERRHVEYSEEQLPKEGKSAMILLNQPGFNLMERSLDAAALRQKVIANNIANVDTPYFKRSDVQFEDLLQSQMNGATAPIVGKRTNPRHFYIGSKSSEVEPKIVTDENSTINNNLNNVDVDYEMSLLAKNQLRYNVLVQQVNTEFRNMQTAIGGK